MCKLSRRLRYILKWNGHDYVGVGSKKNIRHLKAQLGIGDEMQRVSARAYWCRMHGWFPETAEELHWLAGVGQYAYGCTRTQRS